MRKDSLSHKTTKQLYASLNTLQALTSILIIALIALVVLIIVKLINGQSQDYILPSMIVFTCLGVLPLQFTSIKKIKAELQLRVGKV